MPLTKANYANQLIDEMQHLIDKAKDVEGLKALYKSIGNIKKLSQRELNFFSLTVVKALIHEDLSLIGKEEEENNESEEE